MGQVKRPINDDFSANQRRLSGQSATAFWPINDSFSANQRRHFCRSTAIFWPLNDDSLYAFSALNSNILSKHGLNDL